jgi:hypothetical protein
MGGNGGGKEKKGERPISGLPVSFSFMYLYIYLSIFTVLELELRVYTLSHSTSSFL